MTYANKLKYSDVMRQKFSEIKSLKIDIQEALKNEDDERYKFLVNICFSKISVIETNILNLKKEFMDSIDYSDYSEGQ